VLDHPPTLRGEPVAVVADRFADESAGLAAVLLRAVIQEADYERDVPYPPYGQLVASEPADVAHAALDLGALRPG
jgi:hypothetical protein